MLTARAAANAAAQSGRWAGLVFSKTTMYRHAAIRHGIAATAHLPEVWLRMDEWYNVTKSPRGQGHVLAHLDESSFAGGTMGGDDPITWSKRVGKGRLWYTVLGHTEASYLDPAFLQHLLGGIQVAAGVKPMTGTR